MTAAGRHLDFAGHDVPALGLGTWFMGEGHLPRAQEVRALQAGLELGLRVVDTAEMYADGNAEKVVGEALRGRRDAAVVVSKVYPHNASRSGVRAACERSLRRLHIESIDVYLLHWRGGVPLSETVAGFEDLIAAGLIGSWGVSNLDPDDLEELLGVPGGQACATNQILYNLTRRGPELDLLPRARQASMPIMAYSPIEQGRLFDGGPGVTALGKVAARHQASAAQVALAWCLRDGNVLAIPKSARVEHVRENAAALDLNLTDEDISTLDAAYPPPPQPIPLQTL
ncbi:aldo/keto reductase [Gephyromycinifex aptenodytis]|uniref:aldo/keto reductase n=1 Tax=Gephyromycinifex aptenodytis TaxID=2716227 RepID=UPI0014477C22|nr:aldo/keto reductase [Gephyromycinifex aptenodytis]